MQLDWQRIVSEAKRVHTRYLVEVVEAFNLCPWAKEARQKGRVNMYVTSLSDADPEAMLAEIDACMRDATTEIGMVICPMLTLQHRQFGHFVSAVRGAEERRRPRGEQTVAFAGFHPNAEVDVTTPERLVPFLRRSPDPMLQVVRTEVLTRVRRSQDHGTSYVDPSKLCLAALDQLPASEPPLAARVAQANLRTVQRVGLERLAAAIESVHEDRARSYGWVCQQRPTPTHIEDVACETESEHRGNRVEKPKPKAR